MKSMLYGFFLVLISTGWWSSALADATQNIQVINNKLKSLSVYVRGKDPSNAQVYLNNKFVGMPNSSGLFRGSFPPKKYTLKVLSPPNNYIWNSETGTALPIFKKTIDMTNSNAFVRLKTAARDNIDSVPTSVCAGYGARIKAYYYDNNDNLKFTRYRVIEYEGHSLHYHGSWTPNWASKAEIENVDTGRIYTIYASDSTGNNPSNQDLISTEFPNATNYNSSTNLFDYKSKALSVKVDIGAWLTNPANQRPAPVCFSDSGFLTAGIWIVNSNWQK